MENARARLDGSGLVAPCNVPTVLSDTNAKRKAVAKTTHIVIPSTARVHARTDTREHCKISLM